MTTLLLAALLGGRYDPFGVYDQQLPATPAPPRAVDPTPDVDAIDSLIEREVARAVEQATTPREAETDEAVRQLVKMLKPPGGYPTYAEAYRAMMRDGIPIVVVVCQPESDHLLMAFMTRMIGKHYAVTTAKESGFEPGIHQVNRDTDRAVVHESWDNVADFMEWHDEFMAKRQANMLSAESQRWQQRQSGQQPTSAWSSGQSVERQPVQRQRAQAVQRQPMIRLRGG